MVGWFGIGNCSRDGEDFDCGFWEERCGGDGWRNRKEGSWWQRCVGVDRDELGAVRKRKEEEDGRRRRRRKMVEKEERRSGRERERDHPGIKGGARVFPVTPSPSI